MINYHEISDFMEKDIGDCFYPIDIFKKINYIDKLLVFFQEILLKWSVATFLILYLFV